MDKEKLQVGRKRGVSLHSKRKVGIFFIITIFCYFESLKRKGKERSLEGARKKLGGKPLD